MTSRPRSESGQTVVFAVIFLVALLGAAAFSIDVGFWYQTHQHLQNDADASALAGAAYIANNDSTNAANAEFTKNKWNNEGITVQFPAYDTIKVTTTYTANSFFARLFGKANAPLSATATAKIQAMGAVSHHVSPYVVTEASYNNGVGTTLFNCDASGNCGTVDLPTADNTSGGSCTGNVYTGISQNVVAAITDGLDVGMVTLGGCLSPKTGSTQPSGNAVNQLPGSMAQDLKSLGNNQYDIITQSWDDAQGLPPRLIFVPIVPAFSTGTNANMTVTGFAWFYITGATGNGQGLKINGKYVSVTIPNRGGTPAAWVPGKVGQVTFVSLTG